MSEEITSIEHTESHTHDDHAETLAPTTKILGATLPMPLYTTVFVILAVLTVTEVLLAEAIEGDIKIPLLLGIAVAKGALVVMFYMHLKTDSRAFALAFLVPLILAILSTLFLLSVPSTGGYFGA
ncbi:MAG TPA: cytochrome C oxidase subunit IV family protein [Aggregatilineales bacterium]|nr:cytochrome C oxidase subunit IV family protein [Aggregatilineales bacterium]